MIRKIPIECYSIACRRRWNWRFYR